MKLILIILIALLMFAPTVSAVSRTVTLEADGRIELHSVGSNKESVAAIKIDGEGTLDYKADTILQENIISQVYNAKMISGENPLRTLQAVSAIKTNSDEGANYLYALLVAPDKGYTGTLDTNYSVGNLLGFNVTTEALVNHGQFRSYINIYNPANETSLKEAMRILGRTYYRDIINVDALNGATEE